MSSIKLDSSHDFAFERNDLVLIDGTNEKAQILKQNLKFFLGEWFLDNSIGVPYFQEILKKQLEPLKVSAAFKEEILASIGVIELKDFNIELNAQRQLVVDFTVRFEEGVTRIREVLV